MKYHHHGYYKIYIFIHLYCIVTDHFQTSNLTARTKQFSFQLAIHVMISITISTVLLLLLV
jgi:hypothetical protein